MKQLFQWAFGVQPNYVVAESFADAEKEIRRQYGTTTVRRLDLVSPYVEISDAVLISEAIGSRKAKP